MKSPKEINLADVKRALDAATPTPDAARKADAMARSLEIFANAQGSQNAARQSSETPTNRGLLKGAFDMLISKTTGALTATTALVAVGLLFYTPQGQQMMQGPQIAPPLIQDPTLEAIAILEQDAGRTEAEVLREPIVADTAPAGTLELQAEAVAPQVAPAAPAATSGPAAGETDDRAFSEVDLGTSALRDSEVAEGADIPFVMTGETDSGIVFGAELDEAPRSNDGVATTGSAEMGVVGGNATALTQSGVGNSAALIAPAEGRIRQGTVDVIAPTPEPDTEEFANADDNPLQIVAENPVSTFSIDVDTAAYSLLRSSLNRGQLPSADAVRIEDGVLELDGILDEAEWLAAPIAGDFLQYDPRVGKRQSEDTEFSVLYDNENLYLGVRCHDSDPSAITARRMIRDQGLRDTTGNGTGIQSGGFTHLVSILPQNCCATLWGDDRVD